VPLEVEVPGGHHLGRLTPRLLPDEGVLLSTTSDDEDEDENVHSCCLYNTRLGSRYRYSRSDVVDVTHCIARGTAAGEGRGRGPS